MSSKIRTLWQRFLVFWGREQKLEKSFFEKKWALIQAEKKNPMLREKRLRGEYEDYQNSQEWEMQKFKELFLRVFWSGTESARQKEG